MSNQCRSCGRDLNNNYTPYANGYPGSNASRSSSGGANRQQVSATAATSSYQTRSSTSTPSSPVTSAGNTSPRVNTGNTHITAKVMFGSVGAIKELRESEKAKNAVTRAGRRN